MSTPVERAASPLVRIDGEELLTGWGRTSPSAAFVTEPDSVEDVQAAIVHAGTREGRGPARNDRQSAQAAAQFRREIERRHGRLSQVRERAGP
jgi:hypothetical protein